MRYTTDDMRNYAGDSEFDFGAKFAIKEAANEIDRLRLALTTVMANLEGEPGPKASAIRIYVNEQLTQ